MRDVRRRLRLAALLRGSVLTPDDLMPPPPTVTARPRKRWRRRRTRRLVGEA
jgi:hypothetical protein